MSRPTRPWKLLNFSHPTRHRLPVKLNLMPPPFASRTPPLDYTSRMLLPGRPPHGRPPNLPLVSTGHFGRATGRWHHHPTPPPGRHQADRVGLPPTHTCRAVTPTSSTATGPTPAHHCRPPAPFSSPIGLPTGTPTCAPPLPRAGTTAGRPCHLGIVASRRHRLGIGVSRHPRRSSGCHHPHCRAILIGCWRGVCRPHCPVVHQGSRNLHLYLHYSIWIVDCGGVYLA
jgi:hypothetical protein